MSQTEVKSTQSNHYWILTVFIFFLGWVVIYAGRAIYSPIIGNIKYSFDLNDAAIGGIMSLFYLAYTALQVPSGMLGDKIGRKLVLVVGFLIYALAIGSISMVSSYVMFITLWMIAGAAQGTFYGPQYALSSEAIPKKWLAVGSAIIGSGMSFGLALGYNISSRTVVGGVTAPWQQPFLIMAIPIFLITLLMLFFIKEKAPGLKDTKPLETAKQSNNGGQSYFMSLLTNRNLVLAYIAIFCSIYGFFVIITWLPFYLEKERGMTKEIASDIASIVPWISIIGTIFFSYLSDKLGKRKPIALFMLPLSLIAIFGVVYSGNLSTGESESTFLGLALNAQNILLLCMLVMYGFIGKISLNPVLLALCADNAPRGSLSTAFGLYNFFGMTASIIAPYLTGFIAEQTGNLNMSFYFAAAVTVIGIVAVLFVDESKSRKD